MEKVEFSIKNKTRKTIAYSLVELMVSMIVIAVVAAAFTPLVSKRLKNENSTANGNKARTSCNHISANCTSCVATNCLTCDISCPQGKSKDILTCSCLNCTTISNCIMCQYNKARTSLVCEKCKNGYYLNSSNNTCVACASGKTCDGITQYNSCSARWANCSTCTATACTACTGSGTSGWNTEQEICTQCGSNCIRCNNASCTKCATGYVLNIHTKACVLGSTTSI